MIALSRQITGILSYIIKYFSRRDTESVVLIDQAREIERLNEELLIKDQEYSQISEENHNYLHQFDCLKDRLNQALSHVKSENLPHYEVRKSHDLVQKVIALETYIVEQQNCMDRSTHSEYDALYMNQFHNKFTPEVHTRNGLKDQALHAERPMKNLHSNSANSRIYSRNGYEIDTPKTAKFNVQT